MSSCRATNAKGEEEAWAKIDAEHDTWVDHVRNREETP